MKSGETSKKTADEDSPVTGPALQAALRQSEASYNDLFNTIRLAIYIEGFDGRFVDVNVATCVMYGYAREEFIGRTPEFLAAPGLNDFTLLSETVREALTGEPRQFEFWGRRKNGEIFPTDVRFYKGTYFGSDVLIVVATDITGQKQTEKALRESESRYRAIVDAVPDNITITDLLGNILMVSSASIAMFGLSDPDAVKKRSILEFIVPEEQDRFHQAIELLIKAGVALGEFHGKRTDNTVFPLEVHASLMRDRLGNSWRLVMVVRDISLRRHLEETLSSALARSQKQQLVISEIAASSLISSSDVEKLVRMLTERAAPLLGVERAGVWIFDDTESRLACIDLFESIPGTHTSGEILLENEFRNEFDALKSAKFIDADEPLTDPRTAGYVESYLKPLRITSMLDAVIRIAGKNLGVIYFEHVEKQHFWEPDEITFACQLADQIALAVTNRERNKAQQTLLESESFNRSLVENLPEYVAVYGMDGILLYVNPASARGLGYDADMLVGTHVLSYVAVEYPAAVTAKMTARGGEGDISPYEIDMIPKNRPRRSVVVKATPIQYRNHPAILLLLIDITERRKVEEALRVSEEKYRLLVENSHDILYTLTKEGVFGFVSRAWTTLLGHPVPEVMGQPFQKFVHPDDIPACMTFLQTVIGTGQRQSGIEYRVQHTDGTWRWHTSNVVPITDKTGRIAGGEGIARDITERKRAEKAHRESEEQYRHLLTAITDYVYSVRLEDGRVTATEYGPGCEAVAGYTTRDFGTDPDLWYRIVVEEDRAMVTGLEENILAGGRDVRAIEYRILHKNGGIRWVRNTPVLRYDPAGTLIAYDGLIQDVTDRKLAELALLRSQAQLDAIIRASLIPMFVIDNHHRIISWNKALENTTGIESRTIIGTSTCWKAFYKTDRPCLADLLVDGALEKIPELYDDKWKKSENIEGAIEVTDFFPDMGTGGKWLHFMAAPIIDSVGTLIGAVETLEDITRIVQAQQELKDSEERYRTLIDQLPDYVLVHRDGILLYVNPSAAARMGYDTAMLIGKTALQFIAPEYHDIVRQAMAQRMTDKGFPSYEVKILAHDKTPYTVLVNGAVINYGGKPASLNVLTDITTLKNAEDAIRSANEDLDKRVTERTEALILANEQLIAEISARTHAEREITVSLHEKTLLLREIHHRVKNNLQIIASLLNLQSRCITDYKVLEAIHDTQSRVRAMALAHELMYRSDNIADINLHIYLNRLTKQIFQFYNLQRSQITIMVTMDDVMVNLDTVIPVGLIINELVSNSFKHAFPDGRSGIITLTCTPLDVDRLRFVYHDDGDGIPAGFDWENPESLGLRLVNDLVRQLNGTIMLEPGEGTTFIIEIQKNPAGKIR